MKYLNARGHRRHRRAQGVGVPRRRRNGRARVDGRDRAGRPRAPRQPDLGRQLQPAAARRPGARQRQDHPGARGRLPRRGLERDQGDLGQPLGSAAGRRHRRRAGQGDGGLRRRRVPDVQVPRRRLRARALLRARPALLERVVAHVRRRDLAAQPRRARPAEGVRRLRRGGPPHRPADGDPGQDDQGLRDGRFRRGPDDHPPGQEDDRGGAAGLPRPVRAAAHRRAGPRRRVLQAARRRAGDGATCASGAPRWAVRCRSAGARAEPLAVPELELFRSQLDGHRRARDLDHHGVRPGPGRAAARQGRSAGTSCRSCPTSRARSGWRDCSARSGSTRRSASSTSRRTPSS